jgi:hypothetical protein
VERIFGFIGNTMMRESKLSLVPEASRPISVPHNDSHEDTLRMRLQEEIDRLALLIEEVNRQSARVQAAADAIGEKVLL